MFVDLSIVFHGLTARKKCLEMRSLIQGSGSQSLIQYVWIPFSNVFFIHFFFLGGVGGGQRHNPFLFLS